MTAETVPGSIRSTDRLRIAFVPEGSNPLSVAILNGGTVKDLTYSFTPDGWQFPITETEAEDKRLALGQVGSRPGTSKVGPITVKYVHGDAADVAVTVLVPAVKGTLVYRDTLPNSTAWTAAQKVDTIVIEAGIQRKDGPTENGVQTKQQTLYVPPGGYLTDQTLVA